MICSAIARFAVYDSLDGLRAIYAVLEIQIFLNNMPRMYGTFSLTMEHDLLSRDRAGGGSLGAVSFRGKYPGFLVNIVKVLLLDGAYGIRPNSRDEAGEEEACSHIPQPEFSSSSQ
jgi:hypothetical protein